MFVCAGFDRENNSSVTIITNLLGNSGRVGMMEIEFEVSGRLTTQKRRILRILDKI